MNDQIYKNWRKDVGTDYETTRRLVDEDYTRANISRNTENELVEMNEKLTGATQMIRDDIVDDIISMAREAGIVTSGHPKYKSDVYPSDLERFHNIAVAEKNKEIERLREEVRVLRLYGNKDCTSMADEVLKQEQPRILDKAGVIFAVLPKDSVYEKIVESVVNECIGVLNKRYMGDNNREDFEVRRCVEDLKKHFGVK